MSVSLHNLIPDAPLEPLIRELTTDASKVELAIAFVTRFGCNAIESIIDRVPNQRVGLVVSVLYPTDLDAVAELAKRIVVYLHLGDLNEAEELHGQFHSKIMLIDQSSGKHTVVVGSHNWTRNGLDGGNLEGSLVLKCGENDAVVHQTRQHIANCRAASELFDNARLRFYKTLQRRLHPIVKGSETRTFPGLEKTGALVILAEDWTPGLVNPMQLYFRVTIARASDIPTTKPVLLFVFQRGELLDRQWNSHRQKPVCYSGTVSTSNDLADEGIRRRTTCQIADLANPRITPLDEIPADSGTDLQLVARFAIDRSYLGVPVFHAGSTPPKLTLDVESTTMSSDGDEAPSSSRHSRSLPTGLTVDSQLRIPFQQFFGDGLLTFLEELAKTSRWELNSRYRVDAMQPLETHAVSDYVCLVGF